MTDIPDPRMETRVELLEHSVADLRQTVNAGFHDLTEGMRELTQHLNQQRPAIPFKEIVVTMVAVLSILVVVVQSAGWAVDAKLAGDLGASIAVRDYRLSLVEEKLGLRLKD